RPFFQLYFLLFLVVSCQPADDFIDFSFRLPFFLCFLYVMGINVCNTHRIDLMFGQVRTSFHLIFNPIVSKLKNKTSFHLQSSVSVDGGTEFLLSWQCHITRMPAMG